MADENFYQQGDPLNKLDHRDLNHLRCIRTEAEQNAVAMNVEPDTPAPQVTQENVPSNENCRAAFNATQRTIAPCEIVGIPKKYAMHVTDGFSAQKIKQSPLFSAEEYDEEEHGCSFGFVTSGGGPGCTLRVCICGMFEAIIEIEDEDHCYAKPQSGTPHFISTEKPDCLRIMSRTNTIMGKAIATLKFREKPCECGEPGEAFTGTVVNGPVAPGEVGEIELEVDGVTQTKKFLYDCETEDDDAPVDGEPGVDTPGDDDGGDVSTGESDDEPPVDPNEPDQDEPELPDLETGDEIDVHLNNCCGFIYCSCGVIEEELVYGCCCEKTIIPGEGTDSAGDPIPDEETQKGGCAKVDKDTFEALGFDTFDTLEECEEECECERYNCEENASTGSMKCVKDPNGEFETKEECEEECDECMGCEDDQEVLLVRSQVLPWLGTFEPPVFSQNASVSTSQTINSFGPCVQPGDPPNRTVTLDVSLDVPLCIEPDGGPPMVTATIITTCTGGGSNCAASGGISECDLRDVLITANPGGAIINFPPVSSNGTHTITFPFSDGQVAGSSCTEDSNQPFPSTGVVVSHQNGPTVFLSFCYRPCSSLQQAKQELNATIQRTETGATTGVGTELTKIFKALGVAACQRCKALAIKMNLNGIQWCEENFDDLCDKIFDNAQRAKNLRGALTRTAARTKVGERGIKAVIESSLKKAIANAKANQ